MTAITHHLTEVPPLPVLECTSTGKDTNNSNGIESGALRVSSAYLA